MTERLRAGMMLPEVRFNLYDGRSLLMPRGMADGYKVVLIYRGSW